MILTVVSLVLIALVVVLVFWVRPSDLPEGPPPNPVAHLDERKSSIHENLRDLTFEYRLGKLSDSDYEKSKLVLQQELARVMGEIDAVNGAAPPPPAPKPVKAAPLLACPFCGAKFEKAMKFCGECGKAMAEVNS